MLSIINNFLFIHIPKTGGNSLQSVLLPFSDDHMTLPSPRHDGINRFEVRSSTLDIHKHSTLEDYRRQIDAETFARLRKVACIRNPWDRCASFFFSPHRGSVQWSPEDFENFIETSVKPHRDYLDIQGGNCDPFHNVDIVLRFEHLDEDFAKLCDTLEIPQRNLPRVNSSKREHYRSYYTRRQSIDLVARKFSDEIARFGYIF
ncbi:sulfotransferase family 2 domain-containing protein [Rhizobium sp. GN54]|uniref:sulfotransferase family 2 domain-containing protein n=1 Tax=Rhizobium sp. GN54 TaxID=2898150 RepID=UPI001E5AFABA|nr:sulfotransferase family 2 domain-containing protein [Rhizobium sp. GN54]MCD2181558.1 sulfotransferase family protein [Rhizobium sp. GN54]